MVYLELLDVDEDLSALGERVKAMVLLSKFRSGSETLVLNRQIISFPTGDVRSLVMMKEPFVVTEENRARYFVFEIIMDINALSNLKLMGFFPLVITEELKFFT